jgi:hypothetical protein
VRVEAIAIFQVQIIHHFEEMGENVQFLQSIRELWGNIALAAPKYADLMGSWATVSPFATTGMCHSGVNFCTMAKELPLHRYISRLNVLKRTLLNPGGFIQ